MSRATGLLALLLPAVHLLALPAAAQAPVSVTPGFDGTTWVAPTTAIELLVTPHQPSAGGRLAVLIGTTDLTALFTVESDRLVYQPALLPLPVGENEVTVYLVASADQWQELGRFPLQVRKPSALTQAEFGVGVDAQLAGQAAQGHTISDDTPLREQFQDLTFHINEHSAHVARNWSLRSQANLLAVGYRPAALRYGELGSGAPYIDLSDYLIKGALGRGELSLGQIGFGNNRLLLSNFASRGVMAGQGIGPAHIALAAMNSTSIVGWSNPIGLSHADHRLLAAEVGLEAVPSRPGALALQASLLDGSQLPNAGYTQGAIVDAEQSRGIGFHLAASDVAQRILVDFGYARSEFTNPEDPDLTQGFTIVPVQQVTRNARYADVTLDLLRTLAVSPTVPATLITTFRHERVDPLYRSVAGYTQADFLQNTMELSAGLASVTAQLSHSRSNDNVDNIPSLLKTLSRATGVNLAVPMGVVFGAPMSPWLPALSYGYYQIHQFGDHLPVGGGFIVGDIPDQLSRNHSLAVQWNGNVWHAGYQFGRSSQDNRQVGFEFADFSTLTHAISVGAMPMPSLDLTLDLGLEVAHNDEAAQEIRTRHLSGSADWHFTRTTTLSATVTATRSKDDLLPDEENYTAARIELSQRVKLLKIASSQLGGQLFIRYTRQTGSLTNLGFPTTTPRRAWTFNTGVALSVF